MAMIGMDVEAVRGLARSFEQKATAIDEIITTINSQLSSVEWKGNDAEQFRNDWNTTLTTQLRNVAQALRDAQQKANKNAQDQETTSASL